MKSAFLATITLAALALARPIEDGDSLSAIGVTASLDDGDSFTTTVTASVDDGDSFSTTSLTTTSLDESPASAWIDLGKVSGVTSGSVTKFMGITYATARRFQQASPVSLYFGTVNATSYGPSCAAQTISRPSSTRRGLEFPEMWSNLHRRNTGEVEA
ncbi:hypothetical protein D9619_008646 [Psilocybe cf. subviscida]|uniref:Carboxylesterase type B domain-containing protein n=1 Tax=Psilocybe cf. subviscida TaxID=2480587 RepID=A0A8H5BAF9_9AGAR|nr:hypothetical protein D9619_008646 [Psilocybe cf. subviscida]